MKFGIAQLNSNRCRCYLGCLLLLIECNASAANGMLFLRVVQHVVAVNISQLLSG